MFNIQPTNFENFSKSFGCWCSTVREYVLPESSYTGTGNGHNHTCLKSATQFLLLFDGIGVSNKYCANLGTTRSNGMCLSQNVLLATDSHCSVRVKSTRPQNVVVTHIPGNSLSSNKINHTCQTGSVFNPTQGYKPLHTPLHSFYQCFYSFFLLCQFRNHIIPVSIQF